MLAWLSLRLLLLSSAFSLHGTGAASVSATSASAPVVDLGYAQYQGALTANITSFLGMRYAAPPTGAHPRTPLPS